MPQYDFWTRNKNGNPLDKLQRERFFTKCLFPDICSGTVFPAFRKGKVDFYYLGRKLSTYNGKCFQANIAYLAAFENRPKGEVTEDAFGLLKVCRTFADGYLQIKKNMGLYEQEESGGVFELCKDYSCCRTKQVGPIVVLDVENSRKSLDEVLSQDRIDLVLFNLESRQLRFFEVKTFGNKEIWPSADGTVEVIEQIARYKKRLEKHYDDYLGDYCQYVRLLNQLCGLQLPEPVSIDKKVDLLILGFDSIQLRTLEKELLPSLTREFTCSCRGSAKSASPGTLAKWWKNGR